MANHDKGSANLDPFLKAAIKVAIERRDGIRGAASQGRAGLDTCLGTCLDS
jgi:hypothetical protein